MERLILFAKAPRRGSVKTRLVPPLTSDQALALHMAMLDDQVRFLRAFAALARAVEVCTDRPWTPTEGESLPQTLQGEGDLGDRIERALARGHAWGAERVVIMAGDAPTLPAAIVSDAFARLRGSAAVVTPAPDGGYVLVGTARRCDGLFRDIPWGSAAVLETTRRRAADAGVRLDETAPWGDVDREDDLPRLRRETLEAPDRAPATATVLASLRLYFLGDPMV